MKTSRKSLLISLTFAIIYIVAAFLLKNTPTSYAVEGIILATWVYVMGRVTQKERKPCTFRAKEL